MKVKELENYNILVEMCGLILNNSRTENKEEVKFYSFYFDWNIDKIRENREKIVNDFIRYFHEGKLNFAFKYWNMKYKHVYLEIIRDGVEWFNEE